MSFSSYISTHILDTSTGSPVKDLPISLDFYDSALQSWKNIKNSISDDNGRCNNFIMLEDFKSGIYKLIFQTSTYFDSLGVKSFFPYAEVVFTVDDHSKHFHIPLLLSPFSYTVYRGT